MFLQPKKVRKLLLNLPQYYHPAENISRVLTVVYQIEDEGDWTLSIEGRKCIVQSGQMPQFDGKLIATSRDYLNIVYGKLSPEYAWSTGRVRYIGNFFTQGELNQYFRFPFWKGIKFI